MKLSLVVADGVRQGMVIPITISQFLIGRDPQCNLRPSSPAVSKQHAAILIRDEKAFIKDFGSTNGSYVNDVKVEDVLPLSDGDRLKVGPLSFIVKIEVAAATVAVTPATTVKTAHAKPTATASAAAVAVASAVAPPAPASTDTIDASGDTLPPSEDPDHLAAMLLMDDAADGSKDPTDEQSAIPDGTTVMEMPAIDVSSKPVAPGKTQAKPSSAGDNSKLASDILSKWQRRPRST